MPNYYAHQVFGARVMELLSHGLRAGLEGERSAYDLGCLGPDPLFFYRPGRPNPVRGEGLSMHHRSALPAFRRLRAAVEEGAPMARGYTAGFLCHLALDSACHGWVDRRAAEGDITHVAMEAEFDRLLMEEDGLDPLGGCYLPAPPGQAVFRAAACAFARADGAQVAEGYRAMRRSSALIAGAHGTRLGRLADRLCERVGPLHGVRGAILFVEQNNKYTKSNHSLRLLMDQAVPVAAEQTEVLFEAIDGGRPLPRWLDRDFQGGFAGTGDGPPRAAVPTDG